MRTLYIEDDNNWVKLAERLLSEGGFQTELVSAPTMTEALASIAKEPPTLILYDLCLPDSSAKDSVLRIPAFHQICPVVVLSGMAAAIYRKESMDAGAMAFLSKEKYACCAFPFADACWTAMTNWHRLAS